MKLYLCPGRKTSRNWSKPIKWCAFLFNMKIVYTARWRLFATPDTPCLNLSTVRTTHLLRLHNCTRVAKVVAHQEKLLTKLLEGLGII